MAPQQIGQFAILVELAPCEGGVVYKATDPKGRTVALRTLRLDAPGAAEIVPVFRAAAKAASGLSSPNVAGIFGGGEAGGLFFVAVEFVEGVKLSTTLAKGEPVPMSEALDLSRQVCSGLDHAHAKGIVHPELKPSNIIVEWDGTAKIMDFGVPRKHPPGELSEASYYLSPEEVRGDALTPRSNLFSWAAMLYHMVSGRKPFDAPDAETLWQKIAEEMPPPPHETNPGLPPRVSEILLKALAKAPEARYGSGAELLNDLENYKRVEAAPLKPAAAAPRSPARPPAAARPALAPASSLSPVAPARPAPPPPPPPVIAAPPPKPRPVPAPPKPAPAETPAAAPHPPAPVAAAKAASPEPAAAKVAAPALPKNLLLYGMGGAIVLLIVAVGALWMRQTPAQPTSAPPPAAGAATGSAPAAGDAATPAPEPVSGPPSGAVRTAKTKQPVVAAPVETPVATGGLSLDSSPQGAEVQIDGRHEPGWVTPFTVTGLTVGGHTVSFSKAGHTGVSRTAQVAAGQNAVLAVQMAELAATISVSSEPAGASVLLDGKDTGKVTPAQIVVAKGSHKVVVRKQGYLEASGTLETVPGQPAQFSPTLKLTGSTENIKTVGKFGGIFGGAQENSGRVAVRSNPKGAQVTVNGQPVKKTTPVEFFLNPGSYEITLSLTGYKPVKKVVDVEKGGKLTLDETLTQ